MPQEEVASSSTYRTVFSPLNGTKTGGTAEIIIEQDDVDIRITLTDAPRGVQKKYLAAITECPQDIDGNGTVDQDEIGAELVPISEDPALTWDARTIIAMDKSLPVACGKIVRIIAE